MMATKFIPFKIKITIYIFKNYIYLFLKRGKGRMKEGEKHQCVVASHSTPTGDLARNPGMCPDWESKQ